MLFFSPPLEHKAIVRQERPGTHPLQISSVPEFGLSQQATPVLDVSIFCPPLWYSFLLLVNYFWFHVLFIYFVCIFYLWCFDFTFSSFYSCDFPLIHQFSFPSNSCIGSGYFVLELASWYIFFQPLSSYHMVIWQTLCICRLSCVPIWISLDTNNFCLPLLRWSVWKLSSIFLGFQLFYFWMKQLHACRYFWSPPPEVRIAQPRIFWVFLPPFFASSSTKKYSVLRQAGAGANCTSTAVALLVLTPN